MICLSVPRGGVTALNMLKVLHTFPSHTHMHWLRYVVTCHRHVIILVPLEGGPLKGIHLMVANGSSSQQSHSTQHTYFSHALDSTSPLVSHPSSLTTCSLTVSVPRSPQITDSSCLSVHIIQDDPAGSSYIQVAAK